jgi:hypothetical protein
MKNVDGARSAPQLGGERHRAGAAAGTAHRHQDVLLLILFEIGAVEYLPRLLLEQLMHGQTETGTPANIPSASN